LADLKLKTIDFLPRGKATDLVVHLEDHPPVVQTMTIDAMVAMWKSLWSNLSAQVPRNTAYLVEFGGADAAVGVRPTGQVYLTLRPHGLAPVSFLLDPDAAADLASLLSQASTAAEAQKKSKH